MNMVQIKIPFNLLLLLVMLSAMQAHSQEKEYVNCSDTSERQIFVEEMISGASGDNVEKAKKVFEANNFCIDGYDGRVLLTSAVRYRCPKTVKLLLDEGANPDKGIEFTHRGIYALLAYMDPGSTLGNKSPERWTSFYPEITQLLLNYGASPDKKGFGGETPLMVASSSRDVETVKLLLQRGAQVDYQETSGGGTALMYSIAKAGRRENFSLALLSDTQKDELDRRQVNIIRVLCKNGADPLIRDIEGKNCFNRLGIQESFDVNLSDKTGKSEDAEKIGKSEDIIFRKIISGVLKNRANEQKLQNENVDKKISVRAYFKKVYSKIFIVWCAMIRKHKHLFNRIKMLMKRCLSVF